MRLKVAFEVAAYYEMPGVALVAELVRVGRFAAASVGEAEDAGKFS